VNVNYLAGYLSSPPASAAAARSAPARFANVASAGEAPIDFDDVVLERHYDGVRAYYQSKLAQIMFTLDLANDVRDRGVTANCLPAAT
jgi:NAD(P)-dependent dehydrogenase (short-subunit alcohol dehydrogenase family)